MARRAKNFKCRECGQSLYIKRLASGQWRRFMPPRFCPYCGAEVPPEREEARDGSAA